VFFLFKFNGAKDKSFLQKRKVLGRKKPHRLDFSYFFTGSLPKPPSPTGKFAPKERDVLKKIVRTFRQNC
jgi:hypothetical protein